MVELPAPPKGIRGPDATCRAFAQRKGGKAPICAERAAALGALDAALTETNESKRDTLLVALEGCTGLPAGLVRALRAEMAPVACADAIVEPFLAKPPANLSTTIQHVLVGHALAGRLSRMGGDLPVMKAPFTRERVLEHVKGPIAQWLVAQTSAIEETSQTGTKLASYGRGLVAVEAGMADMRLVQSAREVPLPKDFDEELRSIYYGALDEALEPRKTRGRDAALVGLAEFAAAGAIQDARLDRLRDFLSKLYKGRRLTTLDALALPPLPPLAPQTAEERLATRLPTFYAAQLFDAAQSTGEGMLRALLERGIPAPIRLALDHAPPQGEALRLYARARVELGRKYLRALDYDEAIELISRWPQPEQRPDDLTLLLALSLALRDGPENAAQYMLRSSSISLGADDVRALDEIASGKIAASLSAEAAFDAALLLFVSPPENTDAAHWRGVATRLRSSSAKLSDEKTKAFADAAAKEADSIADFIERQGAKPAP